MEQVNKLLNGVEIPDMAQVRQNFSAPVLDDPCGTLKQQLDRPEIRNLVKPGMKIAVTVGSRGIAEYIPLLRCILDSLKEMGAEPFLIPAMGSHGGATAEGQREILASYNITEETMGCPILSSMEVVQVGETEEGMPVFVDHYAYQADGVILCGRVKAHTAFRGPYESGILKMAVIGMGKQHGAEHVHQDGFSDLGRLLPMIARVIFDKVNILGAVAVAENAFDQTCILEGLLKEEIFEKEPDILRRSKERLGKIFFNDIDVLVVDRLGKDISGDGMDPNITGRYAVPYMQSDKKIQHIAVLDLTEETHGNCNGLGLADVTTRRVVEKIDVDCTYPNVVTSTVLCTPKIPLFTHTDRACIQIALKTCNYIDRVKPRIIHIRDTMRLEEIEISEGMLEEARANPMIEILDKPREWPFDAEGNLW